MILILALENMIIVIGLIMVLKDVHILIPGTYEYVTLQGQRNFADVIKLRILRWEMILDYLGGLHIITRVSREREAGGSELVVGEI